LKGKEPSCSSKRVPVLVNNEGPQGTYSRLQQYSETTGISIARVVDEALTDWLETVGAARLVAFEKPGKDILRASKVVVMPSQQQA